MSDTCNQMAQTTFIGRQKELQFYVDELSQGGEFKDPSRIFYLRGVNGMGKHTFHSQLWSRLQGAKYPLVWIRPDALSQIRDSSDWSKLFAQSLQSNHPEINKRIERFQREFAIIPDDGPRVGYGVSPQVGTMIRRVVDPVMQRWVTLFQDIVVGDIAAAKSSGLRVLFVLDNYDSLHPEKKQWFARSVFEQLVPSMPALDVRFLLSGVESFYQTLDLESYWIPLQTEVEEVELPPFSPEETLAFARENNVLLTHDINLHERTGGIPGRLVDEIQSANRQVHMVDEVERLFQGKTDEQRNWILGAVHLEIFDTESLNIFGTETGSQNAFAWLVKESGVSIEPAGRGYRVDPGWSDAILRWQEQFYPDQYRRLASRVEQFREVTRQIPEQLHRRCLAKLSVFNFFNRKLVETIYPKEAQSLWEFVQGNLDYFIKTPFNYQISVQYQPFIQSYINLIPLENKVELKEKLTAIWNKRREDILAEIENLEKRLEGEKRSLKRDHAYLEPILRDVRARERQIKKNYRAQNRRNREAGISSTPVGKTPWWCYLSMGLGAVLLYVGILAQDVLSWGHIFWGTFLVMFGLFWPLIAAALTPTEMVDEVAEAKRMDEEMQALIENDTVIRLMNLKRIGVDNKTRFTAMNVTRFERRLAELDGQLNEPYVA